MSYIFFGNFTQKRKDLCATKGNAGGTPPPPNQIKMVTRFYLVPGSWPARTVTPVHVIMSCECRS